MSNPIQDQYTLIVDHFTGDAEFQTLVKPGNIWRFDRPQIDMGWMDQQDSDTPSVRFFPAGLSSNMQATADGSMHILTVQVEIATFTLDARPLWSVYWSIVRAANTTDTRPEWNRLEVSTDTQEAIIDFENSEINGGVVGWSLAMAISVEFWTDRTNLKQGGY